ncbi:hypothetical protein ACP70R_000767 [Stipagrostis hirtigluma subsp. patula]
MSARSSSSSSDFPNPFLPQPAPIAASTVQLINIASHINIKLDLAEANYSAWRTLFILAFRKFGLMDHIDGTADIFTRANDVEWVQIDCCIVSWLYTTVSKDIFDIIVKDRDTAYAVWTVIANLFLDNAMHRAIYIQQEFHSLYQGSLSVAEYCGKMKKLADMLSAVGHPVSDPALVVNLLRGLNRELATPSAP